MRFRTLIWKEIRERPTALLTGLLTVLLGTAAFVAIRHIILFSERAIARELEALGANVLVLPQGVTVQDYYAADLHGQTMPEEYVHELAFSNLEGVENLSPKLCVPTRLGDRSVILTGILPQSEFQGKAAWQSANLFAPHQGCRRARCAAAPADGRSRRTIRDLGQTEVLLGADLAHLTGLTPGSQVQLLGRTFTVSAVLPPTGTVDDGRVFAHLHTVQRLAGKGEVINCIEIMGCCEDMARNLVRQLTDRLPGTKVVTIAQVVQTQLSVNRIMDGLSWVLLGILVGMAAATIANATWANVRERRREIGTLMALGAPPRFVSRLFLTKALLVGSLGGLVGAALGTALAVALGPRWAGVPVAPLPGLGLAAGGAAAAVAAAASWWPARAAARLDPCLCFQEV
ncbi:MAG: ABC transporter permease [Gemmataceae bacterium]|nr:ABC transporter permease [Gemmataceae bacterium]MDW8265225.1 FtsX-like permease family protein [Gemmataceae bacterium]